MKLLQKTNRLYIGLTAGLLVFAGILLFGLVSQMSAWEQKESLSLNVERIVARLENGEVLTVNPPELEIVVLESNAKESTSFDSVSIYEPIADEAERFYQLSVTRTIGNRSYRITARQARLEKIDQLGSIGAALSIVLLLLLFGLSWINKRIALNVWKPFYENLARLQAYSIRDGRAIKMVGSEIEEFEELNKALVNLTKNISNEYSILKSFTENASHEIQTPLSIIQVKIEEAIQEPSLTEGQAHLLQSALAATERLSRLNKSLLLLAKIENRQFEEVEEVDVAELVTRNIEQASDLIASRRIIVENRIEGAKVVFGSLPLLEILVSNLIGNAIKHNIESGSIWVDWNENTLCIANSGLPLSVHPDTLLQRFSKGDPSASSLGLGLSIVSLICTTNAWVLTYSSEGDRHELNVRF